MSRQKDMRRSPSWETSVKTLLVVTIFIVPALFFLTIVTAGTFLIPVVGFLALAPLAALNYVLWGRSLTRTSANSSCGDADESTRP